MDKTSWIDKPLFRSRVTSLNVKPAELLLGYLVGPIGGLLTSQIFVVYLNTFWTDVLTLGSKAGTFLSVFPIISAIFTIIGNLTVGIVIDKTQTSQGRARPFILVAAPLIAVVSVLMFAVPRGNTVLQLIWIAVTYNLYYAIAYPIYNTANQMTVPLSTRNSKQRGSISVYNSIALIAASSFAGIVMPMIVPFLGVDQKLWLVAMCIFSALSLSAILLQYYFTRERITEENIKLQIKTEKISVKKQLSVVAKEKYWWMMILFYFIFLFVGNMQNFSMVYYCNYILGTYQDGYTQSVLGIVTGIPLALGMAFAWPLAKRFGKKNTTMIGLIVSSAGCLIAMISPKSWTFVCVGLFIKCLGAAPANYVMMALFADVLEHIEAKYGFRCDGLSLSLRSIMMAVDISICQGVFNGLVRQSGYVAPSTSIDAVTNSVMKVLADGTTVFVQNPATEKVIIWCYIGAMMIGYALCAVIIAALDVEKHIEEDFKLIRDRQKAAVLAKGGVWIEPEFRMQQEQEEAERLAEEARIEESKLRCARKGLSFENVEAEYQKKQAKKKRL